MSIDLCWALLDEGLTSRLLATLDGALHRASKPDFIGPIHLSALHLGHEAPEVSIVDIGDVWQGFLDRGEEDNDHHTSSTKYTDSPVHHINTHSQSGPDHFTKFAEKNLPFTSTIPDMGSSSSSTKRQSFNRKKANRLQTFRQYSNSVNAQLVETGSVSSYDPTISIPQTPASSHWGPGLLPAVDRHFSSHSSSAGGYFPAWQGAPAAAAASGQRSMSSQRPQAWRRSSSTLNPTIQADTPPPSYPRPSDNDEGDHLSTSSTSLPSLQLHLSLHWNTSSIRVTVNTSLLINHPSPAFMSLPLSITVTGLVLQAGGLLAFEVDQVTKVRKGHFCLVVEEEEEQEEEGEEEEQGQAKFRKDSQRERATRSTNKRPFPRSKPTAMTPSNNISFGIEQQMTPGEKILSNVTLETNVGQADKHVLRNVAKVERFVVSLVRKAIGDEVSWEKNVI